MIKRNIVTEDRYVHRGPDGPGTQTSPSKAGRGIGVAGISAGVFLAAGLIGVLLVPGGGEVTDKDFTDFYDSSGRRLTALALYFVLIVGCWLLIWFFTQLQALLADSPRAELTSRLALAGAVLMMIGGGVNLGPAAVQINSSGSPFVGVPVAHAMAQAGLVIVIVGALTVGAAIVLVGIEARRSTDLPRWLWVLSLVFACLLVTSYIGVGLLLLPIWVISVGFGARRQRIAVWR